MAIKKATRLKTVALSVETTPPWEAKAHGLVLKCLESKKAHLVDSLYLAADPEDDAPEEAWAAYEVTNGSAVLTAGQSMIYNDNRMAMLAAFCKAHQLDMEFMCIRNKMYIAFTSDCELHQLADLM